MKLFKPAFIQLFLLMIVGFAWENEMINQEEYPKGSLSYLNQIRADPDSFSKEFDADLSGTSPNKALVWNDTLAIVAQAKAEDMAKRNYVAHTDPDGNGINIKISQAGYKLLPQWTANRWDNNFESIGAGFSSVKDAIKQLIIDKGMRGYGHRLHLLGQGSFWNNCYDIGVGYAKAKGSNNQYPTYYCFIIAKHRY